MKFGRTYKIICQANSQSQQIIIQPPFTVSFNVSRGTCASLNSMQLMIYNLAEQTRNQIFQDWYNPNIYKGITFQAGYNGQLTTCFKGNIKKADSYRQGNNIITYIDCLDGGFAVENSQTSTTINASPSNQVSIKDILNTMVKSMSNASLGAIGDIKGTIQRPLVLDDNTYELIKKYSDDKAFIDLEKVNILNDNECVIGDIPVITSDSGLIGTPRRADAFVQVEMIFEPKIQLAQIVEIKASVNKRYNGQYRVMSVNHSGTISESVGGSCTTKLSLLVGSSDINGALKAVK